MHENDLRIVEKIRQTDLGKLKNVEMLFQMAVNVYEYDKQEGLKLGAEARKYATEGAARNVGTDTDTAGKFMDLYWRTLLFAARDDLDCYLLYLEKKREPSKRFYMPRRKVLRPLVQDLQDLADGKLDFLGVSLPPRVGKSSLCIFFMTFIIGRNPDCANVMSGHSDKLTDGFYRELLSILTDTDTYTWNEIFPECRPMECSAKNETIDLVRRKRFSTMTCRSIGGTLTGAVEIGENGILYCDDLIEDLEEALNQERLQAKYDAYLNQLKDRKKDGARELMVGTRWSVADVLGRVKAQYCDNPRYRFTVIPAVNEKDESNFQYDYGVGFSTEYYRDMRASIDRATWWAKYMGEPYVREGLLYPEDELRRYYELPQGEPEAILGICDTAESGKDYMFLPVGYKYGQDYYIDDCMLFNGGPEKSEPMAAEILLRNKVQMCQFESNNAGWKIADSVQSIVKEKNGRCHITKKRTLSNKETKIIVNSKYIKERCLFRDKSTYEPGSMYAKMIQFLTTYTMTGKNKFDDVPDGMAQFALFVQSLEGNRVEVIRRPI